MLHVLNFVGSQMMLESKKVERADKAAKLPKIWIPNTSLPYRDMCSSKEEKIKDKALKKRNNINNNKLRAWSTIFHRNRGWEGDSSLT